MMEIENTPRNFYDVYRQVQKKNKLKLSNFTKTEAFLLGMMSISHLQNSNKFDTNCQTMEAIIDQIHKLRQMRLRRQIRADDKASIYSDIMNDQTQIINNKRQNINLGENIDLEDKINFNEYFQLIIDNHMKNNESGINMLMLNSNAIIDSNENQIRKALSKSNSTCTQQLSLVSLSRQQTPLMDMNMNMIEAMNMNNNMLADMNNNMIDDMNNHKILTNSKTNIDDQEKTEALIRQLQKDDEEERRKEKEQEDYGNVACPICIMDLHEEISLNGNNQVWGLMNCGCCFHKGCLNDYLTLQVQERSFPLVCPEDKCGKEIHSKDLNELLDQEAQSKFVNNSFSHYVSHHQDEISHCPTPDCQNVFIYDDDDPNFTCEVCNKNYCLNCRVDFHKGMSCEEYQKTREWSKDDQAFMKFIKGMKYKQCEQCKFWVEKAQGCNFLKCRCGNEFCYECGKTFDKKNDGKCGCKGKVGQSNNALWRAHNPQPLRNIGGMFGQIIGGIANVGRQLLFGRGNNNMVQRADGGGGNRARGRGVNRGGRGGIVQRGRPQRQRIAKVVAGNADANIQQVKRKSKRIQK